MLTLGSLSLTSDILERGGETCKSQVLFVGRACMQTLHLKLKGEMRISVASPKNILLKLNKCMGSVDFFGGIVFFTYFKKNVKIQYAIFLKPKTLKGETYSSTQSYFSVSNIREVGI